MSVDRKYERDIDLLLAEELMVDEQFGQWFADEVGLSGAAGLVDVWVSKSDNLGESDLIALYQCTDGGRAALMVEDKVDAPMQPDQAGRYRMRGEREIAAGLCARYRVVLCAPSAYLRASPSVSDFDACVSFEQIAAFLRTQTPSNRKEYRAKFLETAATRRTNNWKREVDPRTEAFWAAAYEVASRDYTILEMKPLKVTKGSSWIEFRPRDMPTQPKRVYVSVKGDRGLMDLTFSNTQAHRFEAVVKHALEADMTIHQTTASTAIRLAVAGFRPEDALDDALPKVRAAFTACARLIAFYRDHRALLDTAAHGATPQPV